MREDKLNRNYKNLSELKKDIGKGIIIENDLKIILDNDNISFICGDEEKDPDNFIWIEVDSAEGYTDITELYALVFPKAHVEWC